MEKIEVKKLMYKENPKAVLQYIRGGKAYYETKIKEGTYAYHEIPLKDMESGDFLLEMDSKHLVRWLMDGLKIAV